jgi:hypothetical protein
VKLEDEEEYTRKAFEWAAEKFGWTEEGTSAETSVGEENRAQEYGEDVWGTAFTLAHDMPERQPVVYDEFVTDVVLVDAEEPNENQPEGCSPPSAYTWPCVGGCGEMTNGSQFCCRTYCSNPLDLNQEEDEDDQSTSSESTKSEKKFRWADEADEAERRELCEYSDSPTDDDEEDMYKDENKQKQVQYIIPNADASQSPAVFSCTSDGPVELLTCSFLYALPPPKSTTRTEFNVETATFDEEYADVYDELYGDCEDKKEEQSYGDQADEEAAFTDEEEDWARAEEDGWIPWDS